MSKITHTTLAIDTALGGVSVGIIAKNGHVVSRIIETAREQAVILAPTIQEVVTEAEVEFADIDLIACSRGPGSFTGLRIGLSTARTMALTLDKPIIGLNTLDIMALHYPTKEPLLIVLETKRKDFYGCYYDAAREPLSEPFALNAPEIIANAPIKDFQIGGDCLERFKQALKDNAITDNLDYLDTLKQPDPILMAQYATAQLKREGHNIDLNHHIIPPLYLRDADISLPKNAPRKLVK